MIRYQFACTVEAATEADVQRWLANHARGAHSVYVDTLNRVYPPKLPLLIVHLTDERDRFALRAAFDVVKVTFESGW